MTSAEQITTPHYSVDDESARLDVLHRYNILDTQEEPQFDELARLASYVCGTPIAFITFIDESRAWFKAKIGLNVVEMPRESAFCWHAIRERDVFVLPDTTRDVRFATNPLVVHEPRVRFYAGAPLRTSDGHALGTLCVIDQQPRELNDEQLEALRILSSQVVTQLELRRHLSLAIHLADQLDQRVANRTRALHAENEARRIVEQELRELSARVLQSQEEERKRIAREVHDELGQLMTALRIDLDWSLRPGSRPLQPLQVGEMIGIVDAAIITIRRIASDLRPSVLDDIGLVAAVEGEVRKFELRSRIACSVHIQPAEIVATPEQATALFRILQEALTNIARHAKASDVMVAITQTESTLSLCIDDNGVGIDPESLRCPKSLGLIGIRERTQALGGRLSLERGVAKGTSLRVDLPNRQT